MAFWQRQFSFNYFTVDGQTIKSPIFLCLPSPFSDFIFGERNGERRKIGDLNEHPSKILEQIDWRKIPIFSLSLSPKKLWLPIMMTVWHVPSRHFSRCRCLLMVEGVTKCLFLFVVYLLFVCRTRWWWWWWWWWSWSRGWFGRDCSSITDIVHVVYWLVLVGLPNTQWPRVVCHKW